MIQQLDHVQILLIITAQRLQRGGDWTDPVKWSYRKKGWWEVWSSSPKVYFWWSFFEKENIRLLNGQLKRKTQKWRMRRRMKNQVPKMFLSVVMEGEEEELGSVLFWDTLSSRCQIFIGRDQKKEKKKNKQKDAQKIVGQKGKKRWNFCLISYEFWELFNISSVESFK